MKENGKNLPPDFPSSRYEALYSWFPRFDTDKNGVLNYSEFLRAIHGIGIKFSYAHLPPPPSSPSSTAAPSSRYPSPYSVGRSRSVSSPSLAVETPPPQQKSSKEIPLSKGSGKTSLYSMLLSHREKTNNQGGERVRAQQEKRQKRPTIQRRSSEPERFKEQPKKKPVDQTPTMTRGSLLDALNIPQQSRLRHVSPPEVRNRFNLKGETENLPHHYHERPTEGRTRSHSLPDTGRTEADIVAEAAREYHRGREPVPVSERSSLLTQLREGTQLNRVSVEARSRNKSMSVSNPRQREPLRVQERQSSDQWGPPPPPPPPPPQHNHGFHTGLLLRQSGSISNDISLFPCPLNISVTADGTAVSYPTSTHGLVTVHSLSFFDRLLSVPFVLLYLTYALSYCVLLCVSC
eukprot:TRINITY_DN462_c1_g1_i1.p1 TRINITY_DN462_c1_g1~~TRINITY_DN462_c1_g1_i1.p1  ORF type:complete len:462 (+),score=65.51 TRINITY_DN462_c1_g1_i1:174-1388(+)